MGCFGFHCEQLLDGRANHEVQRVFRQALCTIMQHVATLLVAVALGMGFESTGRSDDNVLDAVAGCA